MGTGNRKQTAIDFDKKFVTYAMAGSAILGMPALINAQTTITANTDNPTVSLPFSFDNSSTIDFTLHASISGTPEVYVTGPLTTSFIGTISLFPAPFNGYYPVAFPSVADVNPTAAGLVPSGTLLKLNSSTKGNWPNGTGDAWLGVEFNRSGQEYLGWADIAASAAPAVITPSQLAVGQDTGATASATLLSSDFEVLAPEPSSLALLALGAAGIAVLRKRRNAVN